MASQSAFYFFKASLTLYNAQRIRRLGCMRLCMVNGRKGIFHRWDQVSELVAPSPMRNGHSGGIVRYTVGIIEYEDGSVASVPEKDVTFFDTKKLVEKLEKEYDKWRMKSDTVQSSGAL